MSLRACAECKREISSDAEACPHCGKPSIVVSGHRVVKGVLVGGLSLVALATSGGYILFGGSSRSIAPLILAQQDGVTLAAFEQLKPGMNYEEAVRILGAKGEEVSRSEVAGVSAVVYKWNGSGTIGANMNAMFQNNRLVHKAQFGLRGNGDVAVVAPVPPATALPATPPEFPLEVELKTLLDEYKANELRADKAYGGHRLLQTHGTVGEVSKGLGGGPFITVNAGSRLEELHCELAPEQEASAAKLSKGSSVTIVGRVVAHIGHLRVNECVLNPIRALSERLRAAVGGKRCGTNEETGDASGVIFEEVGTQGSSGDGRFLTIGCAVAGVDFTAQQYHALVMPKLAKGYPNRDVVESKRTLCHGVLWQQAGGREAPAPPEFRAKVQAFFDAL